MTRYEIVFILKCIRKYHLKSEYLSDPLGDIIQSIRFEKDDVAYTLAELILETKEPKLKNQLKEALTIWKDVNAEPLEIVEEELINPIEDSPI